jgi:hypothetical protein
MHAKAGVLQQRGHNPACPLFLETQLRVSMEVLADAAQEW